MKFLNPAYLIDFLIRTFFRVLITMIIYKIIKYFFKPALILAFLCGAFALAYSSLAKAESGKPSWIGSPQNSDSMYRFYIGRASNAEDESSAFKIATSDAQETAIRENFGVLTDIESSSYQSETSANITKRMTEKVRRVKVSEFTQEKFYQEISSDGKINLWILFKYPIVEIEKEKKRLSQNLEIETDYNEIGSSSKGNSTFLEITTFPQGAEVFIDQKRWGVTPLRLSGVLNPGKTQILISHSEYEDESENLIIQSGMKHNLSKTLKPAYASLQVYTDQADAIVQLNNEKSTPAPLRLKKVLAGKVHLIRAESKYSEIYMQTITLAKNEEKIIHIKLPMKTLVETEVKTAQEPKLQRDPINFKEYWIFKNWSVGANLGLMGASFTHQAAQNTFLLNLHAEKNLFSSVNIRAGAAFESGTNFKSTDSTKDFRGLRGASQSISLLYYGPKASFEDSGRYFFGIEKGTSKKIITNEFGTPQVTGYGAPKPPANFEEEIAQGFQSLFVGYAYSSHATLTFYWRGYTAADYKSQIKTEYSNGAISGVQTIGIQIGFYLGEVDE